jgi:hypothetical protein
MLFSSFLVTGRPVMLNLLSPIIRDTGSGLLLYRWFRSLLQAALQTGRDKKNGKNTHRSDKEMVMRHCSRQENG